MLREEDHFFEGNYYVWEIDDETKEVVKNVFSRSPDKRLHYATGYYNPETSSEEACIWFETSPYLEFCFEYSEDLGYITYIGRFFKLKEMEIDDEV